MKEILTNRRNGMKKLLTAMLLGAALFAVSGCTNAAGGGSGNGDTSGEIDYLARLIGTWETEGYDRGEFITTTIRSYDPNDPTIVTCKMKARVVFTRTGWTRSYKIIDANPPLPTGFLQEENNIYLDIAKVDSEYVYPDANTDVGRLPYKFHNGAFYMFIYGPLHKK